MKHTSILIGHLVLLLGFVSSQYAQAESQAKAPKPDPKKSAVYTPTVPAEERGIYGSRIGTASADTVRYTQAFIYDNVADLAASTNLKKGDVAITKGFYSAGDGGGSTYYIKSRLDASLLVYDSRHNVVGYAYDLTWKGMAGDHTTAYLDTATLIRLANAEAELYADLVVPASNEVNFLQLGARRKTADTHEDNMPYMVKWMAFLDRRATTYDLFLPEGAYAFSPTLLLRKGDSFSALGISIRGPKMQANASGARILPYRTSQSYIFRLGYMDEKKSLFMRGCKLCDLAFLTGTESMVDMGFVPKYGEGITKRTYRYVTKAALWLDCCPYGQFDGLYFQHVKGTCVLLRRCYESHFGYTNVRDCGRIDNVGRAAPLFLFDPPGPSDVSACYFYYFNFEGCMGNFFYGKPGKMNFTHCEFGDIQVEGSCQSGKDTQPIKCASSSMKYDSDEGYIPPKGKLYKWFIFAGSIGFHDIIVQSVTVSNFGNGLKRFRTYRRNSEGNIVDIDGNVITSGYKEEDGKIFALDADGQKITDYYRYYAIVGVGDDGTPLPKTASVINLRSVYLQRLSGLNKAVGPWVVYAKGRGAYHSIAVQQTWGRGEYPFYLEGAPPIKCSKPELTVAGAVSAVDLIKSDEKNKTWIYTKAGAATPYGMTVKRGDLTQSLVFTAKPGKRYGARVYVPQKVYDALPSDAEGNKFFTWANQTKSHVYIGKEKPVLTDKSKYVVPKSGWTFIKFPDFKLSSPQSIYWKGSASNDGFMRGIYIDYIYEL